VGGSRADACLLGSGRRLILDIDRLEAGLGDAKRHSSAVVIASPDRERATARTSSSRPARMSLSTTFRAASPLMFAGSSTPRSSRCEAADRMMSWVSVSLAIGILRWVGAASFAATTTAPPLPCSRRGRIPRRALVPGTVTVPLCSRTNASPFWIMLLLVWGGTDHAMILALEKLAKRS
jgi:hypothetical protein